MCVFPSYPSFQDCLAVLKPLHIHIHLRIRLSISIPKKAWQNLAWDCVEFIDQFEKTGHLNCIQLSIHEHGLSLHFFLYLIPLSCVLQFSGQRSCTSLVKLIPSFDIVPCCFNFIFLCPLLVHRNTISQITFQSCNLDKCIGKHQRFTCT